MSAFRRPARPRSVTITLWGVFLLGAWNAAEAVTLGRKSGLFLELDVVPNPRIRIALALVWAILFGLQTVLIIQKRQSSRRATPLLLALYALTELTLLLIFAKAPAAKRSLLPNALFYGVAISFTYWALNRSAADSYFEAG